MSSGGQLGKRKRTGDGPAGVVKPTAIPTIKFKNANEFRAALAQPEGEKVKEALIAFRNQLTVKYDEDPITATDARVTLANEFLEKSPGAADIFDAWDLAINTSNPTLLPLPLSALSSLLALLSPLSFFHPLLSPVLTRALSPTIIRSIAQYLSGSRTDLVIVALKCLCEIVKVSERWAGRVWEALGGGSTGAGGAGGAGGGGGVSAKVWGKLLGMRRKVEKESGPKTKNAAATNPFASPDIRLLSLNFLLTLLLSPHLPTKLALLSQPSLMHAMFKPLSSDHPLVVQRLLQGVWEIFHDEKRVSRGVKVAAFGSDVIGEILKLYLSENSGSGSLIPTAASSVGAHNSGGAGEGLDSRYLAHWFLMDVLTKPGQGLCFQDQGWYPRSAEGETLEDYEDEGAKKRGGGAGGAGGVYNKVVRDVLRVIGGMGLVGDEEGPGELVLKILESSPELVSSYWSTSGITLDPRLSSKFLISTAHLSSIVSLPLPLSSFYLPSPTSTARVFRPIPPPLSALVENTLPSLFPKQFSTKGLLSTHPLVQQTTAVTLSRCLSKLHKVLLLLTEAAHSLEESESGLWTLRKGELEREVRKRVPDLGTVVGFAMAAAKGSSGVGSSEVEKSRRAVLTEAALRLLSLYHLTLPSLVAEGKFDAGKLLVPAEEKGKGKGAATEAGDGWGFARAELKGVDALSQLHVLRLVGEGGDFVWGGKAGSSPNTYMYHLLGLFLSTPHPSTRQTASSLITRLLSSSVLFEHDPSEIGIWLEAFETSSQSTSDSSLSTEHETFLQFFDDSLRRCLKTPYKYIEDSLHFLSSSNDDSTPLVPTEVSSPLLLTMLEQLAAKVKAKLLADEEARWVAGFIERIGLGLVGKQRNLDFAREVARRVDAVKEGLGGLNGKLDLLIGKVVVADQSGNGMDVDEPSSSSSATLRSSPLTATPKSSAFINAFLSTPIAALSTSDLLSALPSFGDVSSLQRSFQLVLHRITGLLALPKVKLPGAKSRSFTPETTQGLVGCIGLLQGLIGRAKLNGYDGELKKMLMANESMLELFMMEKSEESVRAANANLISSSFHSSFDGDKNLTAALQTWVVATLSDASVKAVTRYSTGCTPFVPFLDVSALVLIADRTLFLISSSTTPAPEFSSLLDALFSALKTHPPTPAVLSLAQRSLPILLPLGMLRTVVDLLETSLPPGHSVTRSILGSSQISALATAVDSTADAFYPSSASSTIDLDVFSGSLTEEKAALLAPLLYQSKPARQVFGQWLESNLPSISNASLMLLAAPLSAFIDITSAETALTSKDDARPAGWTACETIAPKMLEVLATVSSTNQIVTNARPLLESSLLLLLSSSCDEALKTFGKALGVTAFSPSTASVMLELGKLHLPSIKAVLASWTEAGLEWLVRQLSAVEEDSDEMIAFIRTFDKIIKLQPEGSLKAHIVEPVFTVILQDRFASTYAHDLVISCSTRTVMKPAVVVKNLQILLSSRYFSTLSQPSTPQPLLQSIVLTIHALFSMSPATCCQPANIEPLVPLYRASPSLVDQTILSLFHVFERHRRISVGSLLCAWSPDGIAGSIRRPLDIITGLDAAKVWKTCTSFPLRQSFNPQEIEVPDGVEPTSIYDPVYVLSVFGAVLAEGELGLGNELSGLDWVEVIRSNVLGLAVCALGSRKTDMREMASFVLAKTYSYVKETFFYEQAQILYTLHLLRHSLRPPTAPSTTPHRSPSLIAFFFAHTLRAIGNPASFVYPAASRFLLQREKVDTGDVPLLYGMLYSSGEDWKEERRWILRFIRDGMRSAEDWRILQRRHTFSLLASLFQSTPPSTEPQTRHTILEILAQMTSNSTTALALVRREGLLAWIGIQLSLSSAADLAAPSSATAAAEGEGEKSMVGMMGREVGGGGKQEGARMELVWLRLVENVIVVCGEEDRKKAAERAATAAAAEAESESEDEDEKGKDAKVSVGGGRGSGWREEVIGLVDRIAKGTSSIHTVHLSSLILLRLSLLPSTTSSPTLHSGIHFLFAHLTTLEPTLSSLSTASSVPARTILWTANDIFDAPEAERSEGQAWRDTVEALWRSGMSLGGEKEREMMGRLSGRLMGCGAGSEVGGWVRRRWVEARV